MEYTIDGGALPAIAPTGTRNAPLARSDLSDQKAQILVHFTIADDSPMLRLELAQAINEALRPVRVNGHAIVPLITDRSVTMTAADVRIIAAQIAPTIARTLGIEL